MKNICLNPWLTHGSSVPSSFSLRLETESDPGEYAQ